MRPGAHGRSAPRVPVERSVQGVHSREPRILALRERLSAGQRLAGGTGQDMPEELRVRFLRGHTWKEQRKSSLFAEVRIRGGASPAPPQATMEVGRVAGALAPATTPAA